MPIFKIAYLPPLLIYASAGVSGLTGIVGIFFIKDFLSLSAAFIASIGFWAGIPWALKMPIGFLIDRYWNLKQYFVYLGAFLVSISLLIMYGILVHKSIMLQYLEIKTWFILSSILTPIGYVLQDVVADENYDSDTRVDERYTRKYKYYKEVEPGKFVVSSTDEQKFDEE